MIRFFKRHKWCTALLLMIILTAAAFGVYAADYYRADETALAALVSTPEVEVDISDKYIAFTPETPQAGLIFYPGGKVEHTAYAPLMQKFAAEGYLCVLPKMPFNLAVLDIDAARDVVRDYPQIESWYLAGHSLGGSMAAAYLAKNSDDYDGLLLLASYSASDISDLTIPVLQVAGSEDGVLNREAEAKNLSNLPATAAGVWLKGANHAGFGNYGPQKGDGKATLSREEQQAHTVSAAVEYFENATPAA